MVKIISKQFIINFFSLKVLHILFIVFYNMIDKNKQISVTMRSIICLKDFESFFKNFK